MTIFKKILVTGGCGFIGSNFVRYMLKTYSDVQIINLDSLTYAGNPDNLKEIKKKLNFLNNVIVFALVAVFPYVFVHSSFL